MCIRDRALTASMGMEDRVIYSSFCHPSLVRLKELDSGLKTGLLYSDGWIGAADYGRRTVGVDALHPALYLSLIHISVWLLGQGWRLPLEGYQARKLKEKGFAGKRVTLGIRPEDLHQEECSRKNGSDGLNGNDSGWVGVYISVREMLGSEVLLHGNTGDTGRLSARMPASCRVKPGRCV